MKHAEVFFPQAEQSGAINFGVAAHPVAGAGMQVVAFFVRPDVFCVIAVLEEHGGGVPVGLFLRQEWTALENEHALARLGQMIGERSAAGACPDDDDVVAFSCMSRFLFEQL